MATKSYRFGTYTVDLARREVHRGATRLDLPAKVFDCVSYLIEHRDRAVGRDELISAVWGRADISDNLLAQIVLRARRAFDDDADAQRFIRTITGFGYRWVYDFGENRSAESVPTGTSARPAMAEDSGPAPTIPVSEQAQSAIVPSTTASAAAPHERKHLPALPVARQNLWKIVLAIFGVLFLVGWVFTRGANMQKFFFKTAPDRKLLWITPRAISDGDHTLLVNGFWGASRHINYLGEVIQAIAIALAPGYFGIWMVWLYPLYYVALFIGRQADDDKVCRAKYGALWDEYTAKVKYKIVPGLY